MIDDLDVDPADWIPHKSTIVPRVILRSGTGRAVVFTASFDRSFVELINKLVVCNSRQHMLGQVAGFTSWPIRMLLTVSRESSVFVLHNQLQGFRIAFNASDPEERCLVAQAYGSGDWAHHLFETERLESCEEELDNIVEFGRWDNNGCVVDCERHNVQERCNRCACVFLL